MTETKLSDELLQMKKLKVHPVARARINMEGTSSQIAEHQQELEDGRESQGSGGQVQEVFPFSLNLERKQLAFDLKYEFSSYVRNGNSSCDMVGTFVL